MCNPSELSSKEAQLENEKYSGCGHDVLRCSVGFFNN